jgi:hypothetical protein
VSVCRVFTCHGLLRQFAHFIQKLQVVLWLCTEFICRRIRHKCVLYPAAADYDVSVYCIQLPQVVVCVLYPAAADYGVSVYCVQLPLIIVCVLYPAPADYGVSVYCIQPPQIMLLVFCIQLPQITALVCSVSSAAYYGVFCIQLSQVMVCVLYPAAADYGVSVYCVQLPLIV